MICRDVTPVASQRVSGIDGIQDFGDISGFNRIQCVGIVETSLLWRLNGFLESTEFRILGIFLVLIASNALGIGAASFWSAAEKDIAESPTALPERPDKVDS